MNYFKKFKSQILLTLITLLIMIPIASFYENKIFSPHFVDEEDNFVLGKYLLKNEKLYGDLFSHHQPLAYIFSANIQNITEPNSIYLLIKRHREAIIAWSIIWAIALCLRFKIPGLIFLLTFEISKVLLFGNLFLSETLVVYPLIYLIGLVFDRKEMKKYELIFSGYCFSLLGFLLSPLWPGLLFIMTTLTLKQTRKLDSLKFIFLGMLPIFILVINYISFSDYLLQAFYINFKYYIPITSDNQGLIGIVSPFIAPFLSFFSKVKDSQILLVIQVWSFVFLTSLFVLIKLGYWKKAIVGFIILGLVNLRPVELGQQYYSGFHLLPWFGSLIFITSLSTYFIWKIYTKNYIKTALLVGIVFGLIICLNSVYKVLLEQHDINTDFYVNYSRQFDFGNAVKIMKSDSDSLFVVPDEWLIYWEGDIKHHTKMINYYAWMTEVPGLLDIVESGFKNSPPTYLYCSECERGYFGLEKYFDLYVPLRKDNKDTKLLVLKEKVMQLSEIQKNELKYYNFELK